MRFVCCFCLNVVVLFGGLVYCDFVGLRIAGFCGIGFGFVVYLMFWFTCGLVLWVVWLCRSDGWFVLWGGVY